MSEITIHVHSKDGRFSEDIKIDEHATIEDLLCKASPLAHAEIDLVVGDEDKPRDRRHRLHECGVKHDHHVHRHPKVELIHVEFMDLNTNREARFEVRPTDTLEAAWKAAYKKLNEQHTAKDKLLCAKGNESLMDHLDLTFAEMIKRDICCEHKYKIRRPTGGA